MPALLPLAAAGMAAWGAAQEPSARPPLIPASVEVVQVDAVVTDSSGRHVEGLRAEDFQVLEDGRAQRLTNFAYVRAGARAPSDPGPPRPPPGGPHLEPGAGEPRFWTVVVDDLALCFESVASVRRALARLVTEQLGPLDRVAILRTASDAGALQGFTRDPQALLEAVERIQWRPGGGSAADRPMALRLLDEAGLPLVGVFGGLERHERERRQLLAVGSLGALQFVVRGLADLPGRKHVVIFSEGFALPPGATEFDVAGVMGRLVEDANRASVVFHTIDPRGLLVTAAGARDDVDRELAELSHRVRQVGLQREQGFLATVAGETGGIAVADSNDLALGLGRVMEDQRGYYLIGYTPPHAGDAARGGAHRVKLRVRGRGLSVRTRRTVYDVSFRPAQVEAAVGRARLRRALLSPFAPGDELRLGMAGFVAFDAAPAVVLRALLHIEGGDLSWSAEGERRKAVLDIAAVVIDARGEPVLRKDETYTVLSDQGLDASRGLVYGFELPARRPGPYQLRVAVRDVASDQVGSASQFVEVPELGKGRLTLSSLSLRDASTSSGASPVLRRFRRGDTVEYGAEVLDSRRSAGAKAELQGQLRLLRGTLEARTLPWVPVELAAGRALLRGRIRLEPDLPPGHYQLGLTVLDRAGKKRVAQQWAGFDVVP